MNQDTKGTIKQIYSMLDYGLAFEDRKAVVEEISEKYMMSLCSKLEYYQTKMRNDQASYNAYKKITYCMDAVANFLLFANDAPPLNSSEYTYACEDNFKMANNGKIKTTHKFENTDQIQYKNVKPTIQSYLDRNDVPKYIYEYISYLEATRRLISQVEKQVESCPKPIGDSHMFIYTSPSGTNRGILYRDYIRIRQATGYTKNNSVIFDKEILYMLQNHYEPMQSKSPTANVWIDTFEEESSRDEFDIDLLDENSVSCLIKSMCYYGESPLFDNYFSQIEELVGLANLTPLQVEIYSALKEGLKNNDGSVEKIPLGAVAKLLHKDRKQITRNFNSIVKKVVNEYEKVFENDIYYLEIVKGKYKTCSICGKAFLATERNFYKDSTGQFGLRAECIGCFSKNP